LITGDWPAAVTRYVSRHFKELPIAMTVGASGDINPIYGPNNDFDDMEALGSVLGEQIINVTKEITTRKNNTVHVLSREIDVPGKETSASRMPGEKLVPGQPAKIRLSVMKIDSVVLAGVSGELMTTIGIRIKQQSPFSNTIILTHCNGSSGYLCTDEAYKEGGYEPMVSRTMPGVEKIIVSNFLEMLHELD
jgi:neutral ceramidase